MKLYSYLNIIFIMILSLNFTYANNGIWTYPEDIRAGVFGADEGLSESDRYVFNNQVHFNRDITLENASGFEKGLFVGNEGHMISQFNNRLVLYPNRLGAGSFEIRSHENGDSFRPELLIRSSGNIDIFHNLTIWRNLDLRGEIVNGTVPWARLVNHPSINAGTGLVGGGDLSQDRELRLDTDFTDSIYVLEGQVNSISTDMIQSNSVGLDELNTDETDSRYVLVSSSFANPPTCSEDNQALGWTGSSWICNLIESGTNLDLVNGLHSSQQCEALGGEVIELTGLREIIKFCRFTGSSCPSGWFQYENWRTTSPNTCMSTGSTTLWGTQSCLPCTTGSDSWRNQLSLPTCNYINVRYHEGSGGDTSIRCDGFGGTSVCTALISQIGCF